MLLEDAVGESKEMHMHLGPSVIMALGLFEFVRLCLWAFLAISLVIAIQALATG